MGFGYELGRGTSHIEAASGRPGPGRRRGSGSLENVAFLSSIAGPSGPFLGHSLRVQPPSRTKPGDPDYVYDKQVDFAVEEDGQSNDWDSDSD